MGPISEREYSGPGLFPRRNRGFGSRRSAGLDRVTEAWLALIRLNGGILGPQETTIVDRLVKRLAALGIGPKMVALWPFFGISSNSFAVPVYDTGAKGISFSSGFVGADCTFSGGLQGDGSSKYLDSSYKPSELGATNNGGLGWWDLDYTTTGTTNSVLIGCSDTGGSNYYALRSHPFPQTDIIWGLTANNAVSTTASYTDPGHVYGQRESSVLRKVALNGSVLATNTTSDAASGAADRNIQLFGWLISGGVRQYYNGRAGIAYMTNGELTDTEIGLMHTALLEDFMLPSGRATVRL